MEQTKSDLNIMGKANVNGGSYEDVMISGNGYVDGDLICHDITVNGKGVIKGSVVAEDATFSGAADIKGNLKAEDVKVNGKAEIDGDLNGEDLHVNGKMEIDGHCSGETIDLKGQLIVKKDCEAELFKSRGAFHIGGLLNAGTVDIKVGGACQAREIGGETITVKKAGEIPGVSEIIKGLFGNGMDIRLEADTIEGDDVFLENTTAKVVRGKRVLIGSGCKIERVEYQNNFETKGGASVKEHKKV